MSLFKLSCGSTFLLALIGLVSSQRSAADEPTAKGTPPVVPVSKPIVRTVTETAEFAGQIAAAETIELRTLVRGHLERIHFKDGQPVREGELLFDIDARPYKANLDLATAQTALAQANLRQARADYSRMRSLSDKKVVSQQEVESAEGRARVSEAELHKADAARRKAELDLSYTQVRAPRTGRIGRAQVSVGNLINPAGQETVLATIVSLDPMYVNFHVDEASFQKYRRGFWKGPVDRLPIFVGLAADQGFPHQGKIDFVDIRANPQTGTVKVRGILPNRTGELEDGYRANVRVPVGEPHEAVLIAPSAIGTHANKRFVYVVNARNVAERRYIDVGATFDGFVAVTRGLGADDTVIFRGIQLVKDGVEVKPVPTEMREFDTSSDPTGLSPAPGNAAGVR